MVFVSSLVRLQPLKFHYTLETLELNFYSVIKLFCLLSVFRFECHLKFSWPVPRIPIIHFANERISGFSQKVQTHQHFDSDNQTLEPHSLVGASFCRLLCMFFSLYCWFHTVCQGKLFPDQNIPGHDIMFLPAASPEHCMSLCSAHPQGTYFSHIR